MTGVVMSLNAILFENDDLRKYARATEVYRMPNISPSNTRYDVTAWETDEDGNLIGKKKTLATHVLLEDASRIAKNFVQ